MTKHKMLKLPPEAKFFDEVTRLRTVNTELLAALELCVDCLAEFARLDDGTPSISALNQARAAIRKAKPLPPDPEKMNDDRAEWAAAALRHFQCTTGSDYDDSLSDLLGDLMHWCDRNGVDFDAELSRARMHYEAETAGEDK